MKEILVGVSYRFFDDVASAEKYAKGREIYHVVSLKLYFVESEPK